MEQISSKQSSQCGSDTYEDHIPKEKRKDHKVWVGNPGAGLEKRQCSLQLAFSTVDDKLRISSIFRGTGKRVSDDEKKAYHEHVEIYWHGLIQTYV